MQAQLERAAEPGSLDNERFQVYSRLEIVNLLQEVADAHALVTIYFNQGSEFIVTSLLQVNAELDELIYDVGADARANQRLLGSARVTAVTFLDHIKLQFTAPGAAATTHEQLPALRIRLPESLLRLQRRDFYRIRAPVARPVMASVPDSSRPGRRVRLRVFDVSCGGIALLAKKEEIALERGTLLEDCSIELPDAKPLSAALEVRSVVVQDKGLRSQSLRYGCRFAALPPATAGAVQRYIARLERERAQRR